MASKIETLGLQKRVEEMIDGGIRTSLAISAALKAEGLEISQPTIARYLKQLREKRQEETQKIVEDHIREVVPADLDALETMEAKALEWANEEDDAFASRLATKHIAENLLSWNRLLLDCNPSLYVEACEYEKARREAIREIMDQCLRWISDDIAMQKKRIGAMRQATSIIELKLRYSGLIGAGEGGNIYLVEPKDRIEQDDDSGQIRLVKGGRIEGGRTNAR
jgi:predicted transcriptional regulator